MNTYPYTITHDTLYVILGRCLEKTYGSSKPSKAVLDYFESKGNQLEMFIS